MKDLSAPSEISSEIDLGLHFVFREANAIRHNPSLVWNDIKKGAAQNIDISKRLRLGVPNKPTDELFDLFRTERFAVSVLETFSRREKMPRIRTIRLIQDLPILPYNSVDVRESEETVRFRTYPDIYALPIPFQVRLRRFRIRNRHAIRKTGITVLSGGVFCTILLYIIGSSVQAGTLDAYGRLIALQNQSDSAKISEELGQIEERFRENSRLFAPFSAMERLGIIPSEKIRTASLALAGGTSLSKALVLLDELRSELALTVKTGSGETLKYADIRLLLQNPVALTEFWKKHRDAIGRIHTLFSESVAAYGAIETTGDPERDARLRKAQELLSSTDDLLSFTLAHESEIFELLGDKTPKHYLVLNQNRDELRANGGFPGSVVEVTFYKGQMTKSEKKDIYFYDWHLFPHGEAPPKGIDRITDVYGMRDANYYPDFRESFATISRMYEKAGGSTIDGIFAINQGLIIDLLSLTGPISIPEIRSPITTENFSLMVSILVEGQVGRKTSAKDILFSFIEAFEKRLFEIGNYSGYKSAIQKAVLSGEVLFAHRDGKLDTFVHSFVPDDPYKGRSDNFVYPVFTSLSGNKSDRYVHREFEIGGKTATGCSVENTFAMKSRHDFSVDEREKIRKLLYQYSIDPALHEHELFVQ